MLDSMLYNSQKTQNVSINTNHFRVSVAEKLKRI